MSDSLWLHGLQHSRLPGPSPSPRVCSNFCPLSWWCHPTVSSSVVLSSFCLQSFPHQGLFQWVGSSHQVDKILGSNLWASVIGKPKESYNLKTARFTGHQHLSIHLSTFLYLVLFWNRFFQYGRKTVSSCLSQHPRRENNFPNYFGNIQ